MSSLYRKWRSRSFDDLVGQPHVVRTLRNAVVQGRLAHAYLFTGPRGTGKTSMARIMAKAVNCLQPHEGNPCNECEMCRAANEGRAMDVIEIDAASNTSVENVRDLRERVAYAASEGRYKVYIVDEVHRLSGAAFDAFLKTLEEPPPHVIFVFASTEPHKVPATITSRCQRFDFRRIPADEAFARLRYVSDEEGIGANDEALRLIVQNGNGSLRDDLGLLDQVAAYTTGPISTVEVRSALGLADPELVARLSEYLIAGEAGSGLAEFGAFVDAGGDPRQLSRQFVEYWRALLHAVSGVPGTNLSIDPALGELLPAQAARLTGSKVIAVLRAMTDAEFSPKFNVPLQLPFEVGFVEAALACLSTPDTPPRGDTSGSSNGKPAQREPARPPAAPKPRDIPSLSSDVPVAPEKNGASTSTPPSIPVQPATAPSGMEETWQRIVAQMGNRGHRTIQALLRSGFVLRAEQGELVVGFLHDFHRNQFTETTPSAREKRRLVEEVVEEVMNVPQRITFTRATSEEVDALKGTGALQEDDGFVDEAAKRLQAYHGKRLRNSDS